MFGLFLTLYFYKEQNFHVQFFTDYTIIFFLFVYLYNNIFKRKDIKIHKVNVLGCLTLANLGELGNKQLFLL